MNKMKFWLGALGLMALTVFTQSAWAATCTSKGSGNWNSAGTWNCTAGSWPAAGDTVIIASPHTVTLNNNYSATNLTIDAGATLRDNGNDLTLSGNAVINGTYDGAGNNGQLNMTGSGVTLSGTGTFIDIKRIQIDGNVTIPAGSNLTLTLQGEIRVNGTLNLNGTISGAGQTAGNRILRVDNAPATLNIGTTGSINAPNSVGEIRAGGTATNNGSVLLQGLTTQGSGTWTNNPGSSCSGPPVCVSTPTVNSINLANPNPTNAASVSWIVTFGTSVTGVTSSNFTLVNTGLGGAPTITSVTGGGVTWTVTASTGTGTGTLGLDMTGTAGVSPAVTNLPFTGQVYSVRPQSVTANPTLCVNDTSIGVATGNWTGLTNVGTQNNIYAQASVANSDITNYLKCTGYGFTIPVGATITGITVGPWLNATWTMLDNAMQLVKGGVIQPSNLATGAAIPNGGGALAPAPTQFTYGGSTNLWGNAWTAADINNANFGAAFAAQRGGFTSTQQAAVDAMPITINYTVPSTPSVTSINLASTNPSSPATAVSWTVTFSTSMTGVAAGNFVLVQAGGVSGASITSVTGSGSTWTVNANSGSGTGTLGLNMANVTGISPAVTTPMPFVGQVYTISAPMTCITDNFGTGTLDPTLWLVKTIQGPYLPQVVNAGGGDYRMRLTDTGGNEATFAQLKRTFPGAGNKIVLEIDYLAYGGSGADGIAVTFSDSAINSTTGGFGGSLGYANRTGIDGFGGGWLGIGLDEYGNFPNPTEARLGYPAGWMAPAPANVAAGFYKTNVSVRGSGSAQTGYYLLANTGVLATPVAPASGAVGVTPYRYRFTIDHSNGVNAWVTVERDTTATGNNYQTLVPAFDVKSANSGQAPVPASWLVSFTGSTGGATNFHEFKQVKVCANTIVGGGPNHLEIQHPSGTGLTCTPSTLTIKACADAAVPCVTPYTGGVTGTLSASGTPTVNWDGTSGGATGAGFSIPSGSSTVTKNVQVTTPGSTVFSAVSTPAATAATTCNFGAPSCTFTAADTGFLVNAPNHVAETSSTLTVQAVKKADNSLSCVPAFANISKTVNLKCAYSNPVTGTLPVRLGGTALNATANAAAACDGTGANVSLSFNASGIATPILQYADVGQMNVSANYTGSTGALDAGLVMAGTGSFIAAPASFAFSGITAGPIKAGNNFTATVTAKNSIGGTTPNFGKETTAEGVTLTSNLVTPVGGANPAIGNNLIPGATFVNGVATVNNLSWGEVGSITLMGTLTSGSYLGSGLSATGTSATVGAFIPDHFDTAVVASTSAPMPCPSGLTCPPLYNGFVYSGQPFSMQVTARNLAGSTTTNYSSAYGLSNTVNLAAWDALGSVVTQNPGGGALANATMAATAFVNGMGTTNTQAYTFATTPTSPTDIFLRAVDAVNTSVTSLRATPSTSVEGGVKVVSGKVKISNAYGSEVLPLPLTATVQYWNGTSWVTSSTDSLTQFNTNLQPTGNIVATIIAGLGSGVSVATPGVVSVVGGIKTITLNKPLLPGTVDISLNAPPYLLGGSNGAGVNPSVPGRATFGVYKGANEFIYLRENY